MMDDWLLERRLGAALELVARPHGCDESLTLEVQARLWQLGVPCSDFTPRDELVSRLWARKRSQTPGRPDAFQLPDWPPTAA
jgi:hypothetical protein